jgi:hypothetical protein
MKSKNPHNVTTSIMMVLFSVALAMPFFFLRGAVVFFSFSAKDGSHNLTTRSKVVTKPVSLPSECMSTSMNGEISR